MKRKTKITIMVAGVLIALGVFSFVCLHEATDRRSKETPAEAHSTRGEELYHSGRYEEALEEFKMAAQLDPSNPDYRIGLAAAYERCGMIEEAINELETYIQLSKDEEANEEVKEMIELLKELLESQNK
jgi:tetratricopeptide (TPR) repeat protein